MIRIPRSRRGLAAYIIAIATLTFSLFATANGPTPKKLAFAPSPLPDSSQSENVLGETTEETFLVTRVIDGDTFEIEGGQKVRMIGIDTPETVDTKRQDQCFGKEASEKVKQMLTGVRVRLVKDVSNTDSFGRLLRYVYVEDQFVNKILVWEGYARSSTFPPDVSRQTEFKEAEREAFRAQRGLWGSVCK